MNLRQTYLIAGILWALLLGPLAALAVFGFAAGASWIWLYGDNDWPAGTQVALPLIGLAAGVAVAIACILLGARHGRQSEATTGAERIAQRRKARFLTAAPVVIAVLLGAKIWWDMRSYSRALTIAAQREANFVSLALDSQKITDASIALAGDGMFHVHVQLAGQREGEYRLNWQVRSTSFHDALASGRQTIRLRQGNNGEETGFGLDQIAKAYRRHLSKPGDVLVDETFHLRIAAEPVLSGADLERLPPGEKQRLKSGDSALRSTKIVDFPVRFFIHSDGSVTQ